MLDENDCRAIALAIKDNTIIDPKLCYESVVSKEGLIISLLYYIRRDNPRFDEEGFRSVCEGW